MTTGVEGVQGTAIGQTLATADGNEGDSEVDAVAPAASTITHDVAAKL